ncbi:hypothetical protein F5Y04DRAFT_262573 [Hypomontagnella monticulosa]|nr:hypothetical protein F5Y04DRAFT_262573 [Hypomontagnella monticulosa]
MDSENIEVWAEAQKKLPRPPTNEELAAFQEFLNDSESEVWQHAKRLAAFYIKPFEESRVDIFWFVLGDAVNKLTSQNDKLAELVLKLQRLPDGKGVLGPEPWWSDLPYFNNFWTEWMQFQFEDLSQGDQDYEAACQANVNRNAFLAKLTARMGNVVDLDQRERGGHTLKQALERTPVSETRVLAAEPWITYCAESMYDRCLQGGPMSWEYPHNGTNWGVQKGWSKGRWNYWRKRFQEISNSTKVKEEVRRVAKECAEKMEEVERARG